ncbi:ABC transporter permease subunit [Avibacterium paragallinarum]|uniref:ABC transporter permease subunit n=1 Tax=Avibacterium paragallinarum TaxID=728 RepID=UPI0010AA4310
MFCYKDLVRFFAITLCFALCWQGAITLFHIPHYLLPDPISVTQELTSQWALLFLHAKVTLWEIVLGLVLGFLFGLSSALLLASSATLSAFLLPIFIASQAIPVFAIAPLLVLWFGYGIASKIAMTILIIYFPVTAACYDGLRNTPKQWLEQAQSFGISSWQQLFRVRLPAALPALASGLRIAVTVAPIGAIVGEWVGSSQGLGYLMLQANARIQINLMFAALFILIAIALLLYFAVDRFLRRAIPWASHLR